MIQFQRGFSLLEAMIAVHLFIIALLLTSEFFIHQYQLAHAVHDEFTAVIAQRSAIALKTIPPGDPRWIQWKEQAQHRE